MLSARALERLRKSSQPVLYYFVCSDQTLRDPCNHILRALCAQALRTEPDLAELIWLEYVTKAAIPSINTLCTLLPRLLSGLSAVILVVDGVDELPALKLSTTCQTLLKLTKNTECEVKLFLSSRDQHGIQQLMRGATVISLQDQQFAVQNDIKAFVEGKLNQALGAAEMSVSGATSAYIQEELMLRSKGKASLHAMRLTTNRKRHVPVG